MTPLPFRTSIYSVSVSYPRLSSRFLIFFFFRVIFVSPYPVPGIFFPCQFRAAFLPLFVFTSCQFRSPSSLLPRVVFMTRFWGGRAFPSRGRRSGTFLHGGQPCSRMRLWQDAGCGRDGIRMAGTSRAVGFAVHRYGIFCIFPIIDVVVFPFGRAAGMRCRMAWKRVAAVQNGVCTVLHYILCFLHFSNHRFGIF